MGKKGAILKYAAVFLYPFLLCFFYCLVRGVNIFELYLPNSVNNDTLFYYKLVEGVLHSGMPRGYFGFNESHALVGSFAAWSPVILLPWTVWGALFGWNYGAILISNLFYFSLALTGFVFLSRAKWNNIFIFMALMLLYPSLPIHLLSGLPEAVVCSVLLLYLGLAVGIEYSRRKSLYIALLFLCSGFLTVVRPYMAVFMALPVILYIKTGKKRAYVVSGAVLLITAGVYYLAGHYLTAAYFEPLFDTKLFELILGGHLRGAWHYVTACAKNMFPAIGSYMKDAFGCGLTAGTQYLVALLCLVIVGIRSVRAESGHKRLVRIIFLAAGVGLWGAVILMLGKANEGGRHFWCFSVAGILLCSLEARRKNMIGNGLLAALLAAFLCRGAFVPTDYDIPAKDRAVRANVEYWEKIFEEKGVRASGEISYDNTLIWVLIDQVDGSPAITDHRELFALPEGMGINCCMADYVTEQFDVLKSRYIAMPVGSDTAVRCEETGMKEIGRTEKVIIYER